MHLHRPAAPGGDVLDLPLILRIDNFSGSDSVLGASWATSPL
jgi:hypothetical protein